VAKTDTCAFCGYTGKKFAPEHWAPQWLSRELAPDIRAGVMHRIGDTPTFGARLFEVRLPHVCDDCNHGWLSDLENQSKPHVLPFILGNAPDPDKTDIRLVLRWCYFKAISLELGRPPEHRPTHDSSVYGAFKESRVPPSPNCSLALGYRDITTTSPVFLWWQSNGLDFSASEPGVPAVDGYHTTAVIGYLVIDVFGTGLPVNLNVEHGEGFNVLWPLGATFTWPPDKRFKDADLFS
jgi:hypothetical protein